MLKGGSARNIEIGVGEGEGAKCCLIVTVNSAGISGVVRHVALRLALGVKGWGRKLLTGMANRAFNSLHGN